MAEERRAISDLVAYDKWLAELGISASTGWRFRKRGAIRPIVLYGRLYVSRQQIRDFEARAAAGEFASIPAQPNSRRSLKR